MKARRFFTAVIMLVAVISLAACAPILSAESADIVDSTQIPIEQRGTEGKEVTKEEFSESEQEPEAPPKAVYIKSKITGLNVRKEASSSSTSLGRLDVGDMTHYLGKEDNWYKTFYRGQTAYVSALYSTLFEMEKSTDIIESVIFEGVKLLGTPYVYGAVRLHDGDGIINKRFTASKFDCSSYMQYIFYYGADKKIIDTVTRTQIKQGSHVGRDDIKRGDLIFFTNSSRYYNTGIERVGHVALYLGNNYILHTASDHAVIETISTTRWNYYVETRRFV